MVPGSLNTILNHSIQAVTGDFGNKPEIDIIAGFTQGISPNFY
jgi:hypothetical protein